MATIAYKGHVYAGGGGGTVVVDTEFDETSYNAIANRPVALKFEEVNEKIIALEENDEGVTNLDIDRLFD